MPTPKSALIIIDMQQGMNSPKLRPRNNPEAEQNMAMLRSAWRQSGHPIVNVRHISRSPGSVFFQDKSAQSFRSAFNLIPTNMSLKKTFRMRLSIPAWSAGYTCVISEKL
jgi:nicotinamidase-related amidase